MDSINFEDEVEALRLYHLEGQFPENLQNTPSLRSSQAWRILNEMTLDAKSQLRESGDATNEEKYEYAFSECASLIWNIGYVVNHQAIWETSQQLCLWKPSKFFVRDIIAEKKEAINAQELLLEVDNYLRQPYRSKLADSLLVRLCMQSEIHAFVDEMFHALSIKGIIPPPPMMMPNPLLVFVKTVAIIIAIGIGLIALPVPSWVAFTLTGLLVLFFVAVLILLPFQITERRKERKKVEDMLADMQRAYSEVRSEYSISIENLKNTLRSSSEKGVVWPSNVYVLLDDIEKRRAVL